MVVRILAVLAEIKGAFACCANQDSEEDKTK